MDSQFRDRHDVPNRGEIHLAGADHFRGSDDKSKNEGTQETRFRGPGLDSDNPVDLFLQGHGKLKLHFRNLASPE